MLDLESLIAGAREEQRRAIRSLEPMTVVSAGAGTGKTQTLANRFAWLLASDPHCKADQILTLTFTNAAAAEMRERIRKTLLEWRAAGLPHLGDAIDRLDEAYISTIHSFALRVIRESGVMLDIDPGSGVVDKPTEREFWNDLKWRVETGTLGLMTSSMPVEWRGFSDSLSADPAYEKFTNYFRPAALVKLGESACNMYGSMNLRPEVLRDWDEERDLSARARVKAILEPFWREAWDLWQGQIFPAIASELDAPSKAKFNGAMRTLSETWRGRDTHPGAEREFFAALMNEALADLPGKSALKDLISEYTGGLKNWRDARKPQAALSETLSHDPPYGEGEARTRTLLNGCAALFWKIWNEARRGKGVLSFSDFVRYAGEALAADKSYASRFRHIMIDEFQDTDELQDGIIRALAESWPDGGEAPRTVFIVGDIKQSIYRFRYANPRLFAGYMNSASRVAMSCSYRMSGALMERVNMVFGHIWEDGVLNEPSLHVGYEPLIPPGDASWWGERNGERAAAHPMEIMLYTSPPPDEEPPEAENVRTRRKKLASGVASKLRSMIGEGTGIWDKGIPGFRPLRWGDVAVLVRTRTAYPEIEEAFEESGVPFAFDLSREFINRGEVRDLIAYIRALDRPDDELALTGWMESPFSGMPQGAGLELTAAARGACASLKLEFEAAYPEQASRLEHLRRTARLLSPSRAVSALLEDESWIAAYPEYSRNRVRANIRRGVELLSEYESSCGRNLASCADYLRRELRSGEPIEEPGQFAGGGDALRVMTIHSSKGLEFPVVVLMFMEASRPNDSKSGAAFVSRSLGAVSRRLPDGTPSVRHAWHKAIESAEEAGESARLLYVAMTRAQERLICCGLPEKADKQGADWLSMLMAANEKNGSPIPVEYTGGECAAPPRRDEQEKISGSADGGPEPAVWSARPRAAMLSATAYSLLSWCPAAYRIRYRQGRELKWSSRGARGGGSELGTLTHWILSKWDFEPPSLETFLPDEIPSDVMRSELTEIPPKLRHIWRRVENRASCRRWLEDFAARPACEELRAALASGALRREVAFSVALGDVNMVGGIDVFWEDRFGCHVRDWKITAEEDAPHEMYDAQVEFYAMACRVSHPGSEVDAGLIYLRSEDSGAEIRPITGWDELSLAIRNAAEEASSAEIPRRGDCARCPFVACCSHRHYSH